MRRDRGVGLDTSKAARLSGWPRSTPGFDYPLLTAYPCPTRSKRRASLGNRRNLPDLGLAAFCPASSSRGQSCQEQRPLAKRGGRACKENRKAPVRRGSRGELARRSSNRRRGGPGRQRRRKGRRTSWSCCSTMLGFPISAATARRSAPQRSTGSRLRGCATPGFTRPQYARRREQRSSPGATTIRSASGAWRISIAAFPAIAARSHGRPGRSPKC